MPKEPEYIELPKYFLDKIEKEKQGQPSDVQVTTCEPADASWPEELVVPCINRKIVAPEPEFESRPWYKRFLSFFR